MELSAHHSGAGTARRALAAAALLALGGLISPEARAYGWRTCDGNPIIWNSHWTNMYISTTSYPAGSVWDTRLQNAMWHWNNVKGSDFQFFVGRDTDGSHSHGNGVNEVYLSGPDDNDNTALAVTHSRYHCYWLFGWNYGLDETDISFNSIYAWNTGAYSYGSPTGSPYNFEGVALHELGHALGLGHEDRWLATMNSFYPNSGPLGYYKEYDPLGDDRLGARFFYPDGTTEADVAGSPLKRTGGGTSDLVTSTTVANLGDTVQLEFTFHNLSTATETFDIGFYLSSNDFISTGDTLLGTNFGAFGGAGFGGTFTRSLFIPTNTVPGTYYLGFLIDPNNALGEANENNNIQPMPRTLVVLPDTTPPTVSLTAPTAGQTLSGTVNLQANAADNIGVARVDFYAGGNLVGTDTASPYQVFWNSALLANGTYTFTAKATDTAGNTAFSSTNASINNPSSLTINDVSKSEGNSGLTAYNFTVKLSPARNQAVSVKYATANGSAQAGSDYNASSGTLNFAAGQTSKTVTVNVKGDTALEANEAFFVNLSAASTGAVIADGQGVGAIVNDDLPSLKINDVIKAEGTGGGTAFNFTVALSAPSAGTVKVNYATANGTALANGDYAAVGGTLTFSPGQTSKTVAVKVVGDAAVEPNETFLVKLASPSGATLADAQGLGTILNDDGPVLRINDVSKAEGNAGTTAFTFTVGLNPASTGTVKVRYATANGTALSGSDYNAASGTLTFAPGQSSKTITVNVIGNRVVEPNETFFVNLGTASGATVFKARGVGTIANDD